MQSAHGPIMPEDSIPNSRMAVTKVPLRFESCDVEESQIVLDVSYMFRAPLPLRILACVHIKCASQGLPGPGYFSGFPSLIIIYSRFGTEIIPLCFHGQNNHPAPCPIPPWDNLRSVSFKGNFCNGEVIRSAKVNVEGAAAVFPPKHV